MWIRSQDRSKLCNVNEVGVFDRPDDFIIFGGNGSCNNDFALVLGVFKTKQRAFQMLDNIQLSLMESNDNYVYQMPEK